MQGKRIKDVVNRMHVAVPQARDRVSRPPVIPPGVAQARAARDAGYKPSTEKDLQVYQLLLCSKILRTCCHLSTSNGRHKAVSMYPCMSCNIACCGV